MMTSPVVLSAEICKPQQSLNQKAVDSYSTQLYTQNDLGLFNLLQHPTWVFDVSRKEMFWANNASLKSIWNADTLDELLRRDFKTDMSEATELRLNNNLALVMNGGVIFDQYTMYPKGKAKTVEMTGSAIRIRSLEEEDDLEGRFAILFECQRIVDEDTQVHNTVTRGVEMLVHLSIPVCQFDMEGKLQYQNPKAERLFRSTEEGKWKDFYTRFVDKELAKVIMQKVQSGEDYTVEAEHYTQDGPRWFFVAVKRARDPLSSQNIVLYSAQDITEVVEARKERKTVHEKSEFFAVIAHEIRTPLHQIIGYLDLFDLEGLKKKQIEILRIIQSSSSLLMSIINDLLDYTKLENGKLELERIPFRTQDVIKSCMDTVEARAVKKGLTLVGIKREDDIHRIPESLLGDPNRVRQILLNFLSNAIKFTERGKVSINATVVSTSETPNHKASNGMISQSDNKSQTADQKRGTKTVVVVRFSVSDSGIGIDPTHKATLFRKYQQGNKSVSRNYGGTGLGLAICKSLADLMGAKIGLDSEVGVGTTAFLEVPFEQCDSIDSRPLDGSSHQPLDQQVCEPKQLNVLVVEDNAINQKLLCAMLRKLEYTFSVAENGQVAVDRAQCQFYHIILMDVQMPVMDGIEATKRIRAMQDKSTNDVVIIGLTAAYETSDLDYYKGIGMNTCIGKPVRLDGLKKAIQSALFSSSQRPNQ